MCVLELLKMLRVLLGSLFTLLLSVYSTCQLHSQLYPLHPLLLDLIEHAYKCKEDTSYCDENYKSLALLAVKVSNEHTNILLHDSVRSSLLDLLELIDPSSLMGRKIVHISAMLYVSQGNFKLANKLWYS